jgi:zinc transport system substrate-binding protein
MLYLKGDSSPVRRLFVFLVVILLLFIIFGCSAEQPLELDTEEPIKVVTTIYPLADMIRQLGGDQVAVTYLLPAGASPHTYEPTTEQARQVADAALFVYIGSGLDDWASKLAEAGNTELLTLDLSANLTLLEGSDCGHDHDHYGSSDPHFWLDPLLVSKQLLPLLQEKLTEIRPGQQAVFSERMADYQAELSALNLEITEAVASFEHRDFISFHSAWQYFAARYDLHELAVFASFPGQEPSAGWIAELLKIIAEHDVGAILVEPQFSAVLAEGIAGDAGIKVLTVDPLGGENIPGRQTYLELMRFNL